MHTTANSPFKLLLIIAFKKKQPKNHELRIYKCEIQCAISWTIRVIKIKKKTFGGVLYHQHDIKIKDTGLLFIMYRM